MERSRRNKRRDFKETLLLRTVYCCVTVLVVSQLLLLKEAPRHWMSRVDRLEGEDISLQLPHYAQSTPALPEKVAASKALSARSGKTVTIRLIKPAHAAEAVVTADGQRIGDFRSGEVTLNIFDGDYLELDATRLPEKAEYVISVPEEGVLYPENGFLLESEGNIVTIGRVKIKS